jgi:isoleucyl-tRNA synthetase
LWIASSDYTKDILIGPNVISIQFDLYKKIRNTAKFMLGNLSNFSKDSFVSFDELKKVDQFILFQMMKYSEKITHHYEEFEFYKVHQLIRDLVHVDLSSFYLDIVKDRLYADSVNSVSRKAAQTTIYHVIQCFELTNADSRYFDKVIGSNIVSFSRRYLSKSSNKRKYFIL